MTMKIDRTLELKASPERVWKALADPAELCRWFPHRAEFELQPGNEGWFEWDDHGRYPLRIETVEPPRRLSWSWTHKPGAPFDPENATLVEWTLTPRDDGGTTLTMSESGFKTEEHHKDNTGGWNAELAELETLLAA